MMKYRIFYLALFSSLLLLGCKNKQEKTNYIAPAATIYSAADSAAILSLASDYISCMNNRDYDGMVDMLYYFKDNRIHPYEGVQRDSLIRGLQQIPIYGAKLFSVRLHSNVHNEIGILVQLVADGDLDSEIGVSKFYLNPVLVNDEWHLTLLDTTADGYSEL